MKITVQVVLHADDDTQTAVREVFTLTREALAPDTVGLQLQEAKDLLAAVQDTLVEHQAAAALARRLRARTVESRTVTRTAGASWCARCSACCVWTAPAGGVVPAHRGRPARSARWAAVLRERTTPELSYLQARFAVGEAGNGREAVAMPGGCARTW